MIGLVASTLMATCIPPADAGSDIASQYDAYARRSLEIASLAMRSDEAVGSLIADNANFSIGIGDVGRPLGIGLEGVLAFADDLQAETFSYSHWSGIPFQRDACDPIEVRIEFVRAGGERAADIVFSYNSGRLTSAKGWWFTRRSGTMSDWNSNG